MVEYQLTDHAVTTVSERNIDMSWIERAISHPARVEPDKSDPELQHHLLGIEENENRVLRVVINTTVEPLRVITAYFDRKLKGNL